MSRHAAEDVRARARGSKPSVWLAAFHVAIAAQLWLSCKPASEPPRAAPTSGALEANPPVATSVPPDAPGPAPASGLTPDEIALFDRVVTLDLIFPDAAEHLRYASSVPEMQGAARVYGFSLRPQPGMKPDRHFHGVSVAVAPAGTFVDLAAPQPKQTSSMGPNGGFWDMAFRLPDSRYDVRMGEGMLLPDSVAVPVFDKDKVAAELSRRYATTPRGAPAPASP